MRGIVIETGFVKLRQLCIILFLFVLVGKPLLGQENATVCGFIKDSKTGETLIGATVYVSDLNIGTSTNTYGYYSVSVPKGNYTVKFQYVGYDLKKETLDLTSDISFDVLLQPLSIDLKEVEIKADKVEQQHVRSTQTGVEVLKPSDIEFLPDLFGEKDIVKAFQLTSGVKAGTEGFSSLYVRGGRPDQNLIMLDEATVYNISHIAGLFSVFNSDAIKSATLIKGAIPSRFGGRLSSLLDVQMKEGNNLKYHGKGSIGLISSRLMFEGPIQKGKSSFMISGRRSYLDLPLLLSGNKNKAYFYDYNMKLNSWIGSKDRIFISAYAGRDAAKMMRMMDVNWGNKTSTIRWNHLYNSKLFSNVSFIYSVFDYYLAPIDSEGNIEKDNEENGGIGVIDGGIKDINGKIDFEYYLLPKLSLKFGGNVLFHGFNTGVASKVNNNETQETINALENGLYLSAVYQPINTLTIDAGLRFSNFSVIGPYDELSYEAGTESIVTKHYSAGNIVEQFNSLEPRLTATYLLDEESSLKASFSKNTQFLHSMNGFKFSSPISLWIPSMGSILPSYSYQYTLGYYRNLFKNRWQFSAEGYYKDLYNQKDFLPGTDVFFDNVMQNIVEGNGNAYGLELSARKVKGRFTGWINYTYSRVWQKTDRINSGEKYPSYQDRPHDINIVIMYKPSKRVELSALWTFQTGQPYNVPLAHYTYKGVDVPIYSKINSRRYKDYHRLDLSISIYSKRSLRPNRKFKRYWSISIYNVYGRQNPWLHTYGNKPLDELGRNKRIDKATFFRFVPMFNYNFKF
ncbi:MAG: TonB-dependent receptor domain-containing protein [Bacteroidales bacterium]